MCRCLMNRRTLLKLSGAGTLLLGGCDDVNLVSDATVEAMGLQAWADIRQKTPVTADAAMQTALNDVSAQLLVAAGEVPRDWEVLVFRGAQINAFALPGRKIGIYEGCSEWWRTRISLPPSSATKSATFRRNTARNG